MEPVAYKTVSNKDRFKVLISESEYASADGTGFCVGCGAEAGCVEPDARQRECESCSARLVYGLEELLLMGLLEFKEDE